MCGIIGYSGKTEFDKNKIVQLMIWNAFARGTDATGIFSPKNNLVKTTDPAPLFLIKNLLIPDKMLMAHTRAATVGNKDSAKNAHPFQAENITLLHNGTLKNHWPLLRKYDLKWADHDVDSQVICSIINKQQNFDVLKEIDGAAAMLINNKDTPEILYVFRNKERPLFKGTISGNMYISSIKESLELIGAKNVKEFKEDILYRIKDGIILNQIKITNKPYSEKPKTSTFNSKYEVYPLATYLNTWLMLKNLPSVFTKNYYDLEVFNNYLIEGYESKSTSFTIRNDKGEYVEVNKYDFYYEGEVITIDKYVKSLVPLTYGEGKTKKDICVKGEYFLVTEDKLDGSVKATHLKTNESYNIGKNFLSRLNEKEEMLLIEALDNEDQEDITPINQIGMNFDASEILNSFPEEDEDTSKDNLEPDQIEDEDDIIEVSQKQLLEDFDFIDNGLDEIYEELTQIVPEDKKEKFMDIYNILQARIGQCKDQYNVEFETN